MKKIVSTLTALALCAFVTSTAFAAAANIRMSQVYPGGGIGTGFYTNDYVELFNPTGAAVSIGGWSLQYGSATGSSFGSPGGNDFVFPANAVIQPCKYVLIQLGTTGTGGTALPVTPDYTTANINMQANNGKIALIKNSTLINPCSGNTAGAIYADVVGYGTGNCYETTAAAATSGSTGLVRGGGGMTDLDNNSTDLALVTNPVPHNSSSLANVACLATPATRSTWGQVKSIYR